MRHFIKLSPEAQSAANWQAARGHDGSAGTPLPAGISTQASDEIAAHVPVFRLAVHMAKTERLSAEARLRREGWSELSIRGLSRSL